MSSITKAHPMQVFTSSANKFDSRNLFCGAALATAIQCAYASPQQTRYALPATHASIAVAAAAAEVKQVVVFVDSRVENSDVLVANFGPTAEVIYLNQDVDGFTQIANHIKHHRNIAEVHVISHGEAGALLLGENVVSNSNLEAYADELQIIKDATKVGGGIYLWGCDVGAGAQGLAFVNSLAALTGRDIAASNDRTGKSGDWELEIVTGAVEASPALMLASTSDYGHDLDTIIVTSNANTGAGTLRQAISDAITGDTITFNAGMTVTLSSGQLSIAKNLIIDGDLDNNGTADVTVDANYTSRVFSVSSGNTVTLEGLVITHGSTSGNGGNGGTSASDGANAMGAGISNAGTLTIRNSSVTANGASGGGGGGGVATANVGGGGGGGGPLNNGGPTGIGGAGGAAGPGTGEYAGQAGSGGAGGRGGGYYSSLGYMGGRGATSTGGAGGIGNSGYSNGGAGATATSGALSIGGGGGGSGWDATGRTGGSASGGIYNAVSGTIFMVGTSTVTNNLGAGGGGGGGSGVGGSATTDFNGGAGGRGVGGIWNVGTLNITAANFAAMTGNDGTSGSGGLEGQDGVTGTVPAAQDNIYNGGTINTSYVPAPTVTIGLSDSALRVGETSIVTFTFSDAVTGFDNADLTIPNGSMTAVSSGDSITWTSTYTPTASVQDATNLIVVDMTGVSGSGNPGVGTTSSGNFTIDTLRPTAGIVVADSALRIGETSLITITFSEVVTGFTNADLTIANGTLSSVSSVDGGITWTATLTPTASITDSTNVITLDNTGLTDAAGNAGTGTTDSNNYAIDTVRPTASIVVSDNDLAVGETSGVTITFSEAVTGFTNADLTIANATLSSVSSSNGGITWTATLTPTASITDATNVITLANTGVADAAGNAGTGTTNSNNYAIDTTRPTASIVVADTSLSIGETSLVTITFSEAVSGFDNSALTVANGTLSAVSTSDDITFTATFTPTASVTDATNLITLDNTYVADAAGNSGSGTTNSNNYAIDSTRPTASIVVADTSLAVGETSLVTITFSEAVTGFANADLIIPNGTLSAVSSLDSGVTWTATLTPTASITDSTNVIILDNTGVQDVAGNAGTGTTDSNNYAVSTVRPTATVVVADNSLLVGETSLVTITFSEAVTGFDNADLIIANGTLSAVSSSNGGVIWTATLTPTASVIDANNVITLDNTGFTSAAGNTGTGTTDSNNYAIDTARPTASIVVADTALATGETSLVTITFSEAITGFTLADLTVANGTLGGLSSSDGIIWTATFTPTASTTNATNLITLDNAGVTDAAGNAGTGTTDSNNYAIDSARPTASIVVADTALAIGETSLVTITFSEAITGFTLADLAVANGTLGGLSSSDGGITWTATLTPTASITDATNLITLDNTGVTDTAGNAGTGTTNSNNYAIDSVRPTASIVVADTSLAAGETSLVTITFSEAITGFTNADLSIANGTLSALNSSDGGVTWTVSLTPTASVNDPTNVITLNGSGIADAAGNTGTGTTDSNNYAIDTLRPSATIMVATTALIEGDTSAVTLTFNEAVTGFTNADLTIENGTLSGVSSSDGGITWVATLTAAASVNDSTNVITLANTGVMDASGNTGAGNSTSNNYTVNMANSAPILSGLNGGSTYIENGTAAVIDADASVSDADFDALNSADGNYSGAVLTIARSGSPVSSDTIGFNNGNGITQIGNVLIKNGLTIASIDASAQGQWVLTFTDLNIAIPTRADVAAIVRQLTYSSSNNDPAASVNLDVVLSDGVASAQGVASVAITPVNDAPTLTATASSPTFTENGSAVSLFGSAAISTVEAGQLITELELTVANLVNAENEIVAIDGSNLALTQGSSVTTTTNGMTADVTVSGSTATVVLTKSAGISTAAAEALVNGISYRNTSEATTNSTRTITLTRVKDNGGTADSGIDVATTSVASVVTVTAVNAEPTISGSPATSVSQGATYLFVPGASDVDGDALVFSIMNKPTWASFDTATGILTGIAVNADVGVTSGIVISVSDGVTSTSLPAFNLTVVNVNDAPTISGAAATSVDQDSAYSFIPVANDIDLGTTLTFSITNKPVWAIFDTSTGALTGTPVAANVGTDVGIVISVSDGTSSVSLPAFSIQVNSTVDPLLPVLTVPADLQMNATALYTPVSLRQLLRLASNSTQTEVDAALSGLAKDSDGNVCCTIAATGVSGTQPLLLPPGRHEITWTATNMTGVTTTGVQVLDIRPLVSLSKSQIALRGSNTEFRIILNGPAPTYPVSVSYVLDENTTANADEHTLTNGTATLASNGQLEVAVPVTLKPGSALGDSQIVVRLSGDSNIGATSRHTISIREGNVAPAVRLSLTQNSFPTTTITPNGGPVSVVATVTDLNVGDTHTFDWSATAGLADTDGNLTDATRVFNATGLTGSHQVQISVTDSAGAQVQAQLNFRVLASLPILSADVDTDSDGIDDDLEGIGDSDGNGIPDYLDNMPSSNILPQQIVSTNRYLIECDPGVRCGLGLLAMGSSTGGVQILDSEVATLGDLKADASFTPVGGIFDFAISDLPTAGQSVNIAIPQVAPIPANAIYRKFQNGQWVNFVENADNVLRSASGNPGYCPPPGSVDWQPGLVEGNYCVQLTISDGGPNDADGIVNSAVVDPGAVSVAVTVTPPVQPPVNPPALPPVEIKTKGGGGAVDYTLLLLVGGLLLTHSLVRRRSKLFAVGTLLLVSVSSQANDFSDHLYLRVDAYKISGGKNQEDFNSQLLRDGYRFSLSKYDVDRTGGQISLGYKWNENIYTELGYLDLGDVKVNLWLDGAENQTAFGRSFAQHYPTTASGVTLVQGLRMTFNDQWSVSPEVGVFIWKEEVEVNGATFRIGDKSNEDLLVGARLDYQVTDSFGLGLGVRSLLFNADTVNVWGVSTRWDF